MKVVDRKQVLNIICSISVILSYSLFLKCYFPLKQGLDGYASAQDAPTEPVSGRTGLPYARYNRLVLMVIDALRTDFVLAEKPYMPFTRRLLRSGHGVAFSAKTHLPTVTLPRIKAITSGSIPGFVDVILNFGSTALTEDNLISQLKFARKTQTFFGDDTWLNLFPDHFTRNDGTTSFFVTDFTEVDINVTRHLSKELTMEDWDVMILHYLGLDHIGHVYGPASKLVPEKLKEMDSVVQQIYSAMTLWGNDKSTLFVICGDHGMSDQGGHGGASPGETSVPVIMISPHNHFLPQQGETWELLQIDLCPTLSALLGLPIPRNNLGRVEVAALPSNTPLEDKVRLLQLNAAQMVNVLSRNVENIEKDHAYQMYQDSLAAHSSWLGARNSSSSSAWEAEGTRVLMYYQDTVQKMSQRIAQTSTSYDMYGMIVAIASLWMNFFLQVSVCFHKNAAASLHIQTGGVAMMIPLAMIAIFGHVTICTSQYHSDLLCGTSLVSLTVQFVTVMMLFSSCVLLGKLVPSIVTSTLQGNGKHKDFMDTILVGYIILHSLSLTSSSFVEEEHQTWYFFASSLHTLLILHHLRCLSIGLRSAKDESAEAVSQHDGATFSTFSKTLNSFSSHTFKTGVTRKNRLTSEQCLEENASHKNMTVKERICVIASLIWILFSFRVLRRWNQTGNKWLDVPDVGNWLVRPENKSVLSTLVVISLLCILLSRVGNVRGLVSKPLFAGAFICIYLSKAASGSLLLPEVIKEYVSSQGVMEAKTAYLLVLGILVCHLKWSKSADTSFNKDTSIPSQNRDNASYCDRLARGSHPSTSHPSKQLSKDNQLLYSEKDSEGGIQSSDYVRERHKTLWEGVQVMWLCVMCILLRPHNLTLVAMVSLVEKLTCSFLLPSVQLRPSVLLLFCLMMGQATFFFQGNSNSLSTVDVSAGLTALYDYQPIIIGVQMAMSTYAGIIFWLISSIKYVTMTAPLENTRQWFSDACIELSSSALLTRALPLSVYTVLVTLMRYHLFVWTVFSPKLLYEGMLVLVIFVYCVVCHLISQFFHRTSKLKL